MNGLTLGLWFAVAMSTCAESSTADVRVETVLRSMWSRCADAPDDPLVFYFEASWCGPCHRMTPVVKKLQDEGHAIERIDVAHDPDTARRFNVHVIPATVALVDGREAERIEGIASEERLRALFHSVPKGTRPLADCVEDQCRSRCSILFAGQSAVPAASRTVSLIRATYPLEAETANALLGLLKLREDADLECDLCDEGIEITATPQKQMAVGRFIELFLGARDPQTTCCDRQGANSASCIVPVGQSRAPEMP